jgi:hypothetical protein
MPEVRPPPESLSQIAAAQIKLATANQRLRSLSGIFSAGKSETLGTDGRVSSAFGNACHF